MAASNITTAILNFIALMCSIPIIASGIWLASKTDSECVNWLRWPLVFLGVAFLLVALTGFVGAYGKKEGLLGVYLVSMAILIVLLIVFVVLAFSVMGPNGAYLLPGIAFHEYRLEGYAPWLRDHVTDSESWVNIRACLAGSGICPRMAQKYITAPEFFAAPLSPIESGCCKPPVICGYQFETPVTWVGVPNIVADVDCAIWNNDPSQLCYNCDSCKAGLLGNLRHEWRRVNIILIVTIIVLIWVYVIAWKAYKHTQK